MKGQLCAFSNQLDKGRIKMQKDINITIITNEKYHGQLQEVAADLPADVMAESHGLLLLLWEKKKKKRHFLNHKPL